jgi:hypothetical protein
MTGDPMKIRVSTTGLLAAGLLLSPIATASEVAIEKCRQAPTADARIACLEAALRGESLSEAPLAEEAPAIAPSQGDKRSEATAATTAVVSTGPESGNDESPAAAEAADASEPAPQGIGSEQVAARNMTREEQLASLESATGLRVERYSEVPYRRLVVHLENGQVWRQIAGDDQYFRIDLERNQTVDIQETSIGGYKLRLNEMRRTIRVERIE